MLTGIKSQGQQNIFQELVIEKGLTVKKPRNNYTLFIINAGTYPYDTVCFFGSDKTPLLQKIKYSLTPKEFVDLEQYEVKKGFACIFESGVSLLWLPKVPSSIRELGHLNHEIWHITDEILRRIGVNLSSDSTEAFAYLLEHISVKIWNSLGINISLKQ